MFLVDGLLSLECAVVVKQLAFLLEEKWSCKYLAVQRYVHTHLHMALVQASRHCLSA